jgi:TRAP-type C4-dicarboxylate transport system permease small subunit
MLRLIRRLADVVETVATIGGVILLVVVAALAATEIVARSAFGSSSLIVVDLSLQLAILMYFIGYAALLNGDRDIRMDYLYLRFPAKARRLIDVATSLLIVGFFALLL